MREKRIYIIYRALDEALLLEVRQGQAHVRHPGDLEVPPVLADTERTGEGSVSMSVRVRLCGRSADTDGYPGGSSPAGRGRASPHGAR